MLEARAEGAGDGDGLVRVGVEVNGNIRSIATLLGTEIKYYFALVVRVENKFHVKRVVLLVFDHFDRVFADIDVVFEDDYLLSASVFVLRRISGDIFTSSGLAATGT